MDTCTHSLRHDFFLLHETPQTFMLVGEKERQVGVTSHDFSSNDFIGLLLYSNVVGRQLFCFINTMAYWFQLQICSRISRK